MFTTGIKEPKFNLVLEGMGHFGSWLFALAPDEWSLSMVAKQVCYTFQVDYCAIHMRSEGKWCNLTGNFSTEQEHIPDSLRCGSDHSTCVSELAEEQMVGVRYIPIPPQGKSVGLLAVKNGNLSERTGQAIAVLIALYLKGHLRS